MAEAPGRSGSWVSFFHQIWPVVVTVTALLTGAVLLGLATRFATVSSFKELTKKVEKSRNDLDDHETRLKMVERHCSEPPTRVELQEDIAELSERMKGVEVGMQGVNSQLGTTNTYLHTLIERGLVR